MSKRRNISLTFLAFIFLFTLNSAKASRVVETPQTTIKDQGAWSDCWVYSSVALIESLYLSRKQINYDFSENFLTFQLYIDKFGEGPSLLSASSSQHFKYFEDDFEELIEFEVIPFRFKNFIKLNSGKLLNDIQKVAGFLDTYAIETGSSFTALSKIAALGLRAGSNIARVDTTKSADQLVEKINRYKEELLHLQKQSLKITSFVYETRMILGSIKLKSLIDEDATSINQAVQEYAVFFKYQIAPVIEELEELSKIIPIDEMLALHSEFLENLESHRKQIELTVLPTNISPYEDLNITAISTYIFEQDLTLAKRLSYNLLTKEIETTQLNTSVFGILESYIIKKGTPVTLGYYHCRDYFDSKSGKFRLPENLEKVQIHCKEGGFHSALIAGLNLDDDDKVKEIKIKNSWGTEIGDAGYIYITRDQLVRMFQYVATVD